MILGTYVFMQAQSVGPYRMACHQLLALNPLLKLSAHLNQGHDYKFELPLQSSEPFIQ